MMYGEVLKMVHKTFQDYPEGQKQRLQGLKNTLANGASYHQIRSVRTVVNKRYDVPALRIESQTRSVTNSVRDEMDEAGVDILSAFSTVEGNQVVIVGHRDGGSAL